MQQPERAEVTVYGEVQRVGYRYLIQDTARKLGVKGYVQNMPDGTVKIIAEAPKRVIQKFIKKIKIKEPPINIERIQAKYSKPTNEFKYFIIKYGELAEEMAEGFGTGLKYMNLSRAENKQGFQKLGAETRGGFKKLRNEVKGGFDTLGNEVRGGFETSKTEMKNGFQKLGTETKKGFQTLRTEMKGGFQTLQTEMSDGFQTVVGEIKGMREDTNRNFQEMSAKYDTISKTLGEAVKTIQEDSTKTRKELIRAVDNLSRLVEKFIGKSERK